MIRKLINQGAFAQFHYKVSRNSFVVYLTLLAESPDGESVEISLDTLCKRTGWSVFSLHNTIKSLEHAGLISRMLGGKPGSAQLYKIHQPAFKKLMRAQHQKHAKH